MKDRKVHKTNITGYLSIDIIDELELLDKAYAAENVGTADERVYPDLRNAKDCGYFTTVYIAG